MEDGAGRVKRIKAETAPGLTVLGHGLTFLETLEESDDSFFLWEMRTPAGGMVPPHTEENHEAFYVLEGSFEIEADGELFTCRPGDFLSVGPGVVHTLRNAGEGWGRMLTIVSRTARHRRFFETLGEPLEAGADPPPMEAPPDFERIDAVGRENGIHFLPPAEAEG